MNKLEEIFVMYMSDKENDSEEIIEIDEKIGTYMKQIELKKEEYFHLEKLLVDSDIAYEKQGFISGFQYAVKLLAPML